MPARVFLPAVLAALLLAPPSALGAAGTVREASVTEGDYDIREDYTYTAFRLAYRATPGTASDVTVRFRAKGRATVTDPGGVTAGRGCRQASRTRAECRVTGRRPRESAGAMFNLGAGDDVLRLRGVPRAGSAAVVAGAGADRVEGSGGADLLIGGGGADRLRGGRGRDVLFLGARRDGADELSGGPGRDEVSYEARARPLHLDLDGDADDGEAGEGDRILPDVEALEGGRNADELVGDGAGNTLDGGPGGADHVVGGGGPDRLLTHAIGARLEGGDGDDLLLAEDTAVLDGGPGRDVLRDNDAFGDSTLLARDGEADELSCNDYDGDELLDTAVVDGPDVVLGCATLDRAGTPAPRIAFNLGVFGETLWSAVRRRVGRSGRVLTAYVACPADMPAGCGVRLRIRAARGGGVLDRTRTIEPGALGRFRVTLPLGARGPFRLRLDGTDATGAAVVQEERDVTAR